MEDLIGLLLFVVVMAASAIANIAERRKRAGRQEAARGARPAGRTRAKPEPGKGWQAPPDEVRQFLEKLERRLTGEAPETPPRRDAAPARTAPGTPPVLSPRTLRPPPARSTPPAPAAPSFRRPPAEVRRPPRIQPRRPLRPGPPAAAPVPAPESAPTTTVTPAEVLREASSALDAAFSAADYSFATPESHVPQAVRTILDDRDSLRRAVIAREILGPPRAMTM